MTFSMEKTQTVEIRVHRGLIADLGDDEKRWMTAAIEAAKKAYAPYSHFQVGAVAVLEDGTFVSGSNQENAAYPSGLCAERTTLFAAGAQYPDTPVKALSLVALKDGEIQEKISPCGACRQVLLETELRYHRPMQVWMCGRSEFCRLDSAEDLLPLSFGSADLLG